MSAAMVKKEILVDVESAMLKLGSKLAEAIVGGCVMYLHGDLGVGKTTMARGIITGLGYKGRVKSPTYTLVESYRLNRNEIYHFDLYRLNDPEELEFLGVRDYLLPGALIMVEWPDKGRGYLPTADLDAFITYADSGRLVCLQAVSAKGGAIVKKLNS
jgi:tRNA threonylcarbamoyladenosine biosynthesis protein TsaE